MSQKVSLFCISGVQRQIIHCVEKTTGIVEEHFCDHLTRLDHNQTSCNKDPCPAMWVGVFCLPVLQKDTCSVGTLTLAHTKNSACSTIIKQSKLPNLKLQQV